MVRTARKLKKEKGILSKPEAKLGNKLPESTILLAIEFFQEDGYSRIMARKKDFLSLGHRQYVQKCLLLCNLRELYQLLEGKYPDIKKGFSSFCSLRPKWCVLAESSGTHSVCICATHQTAILLVNAVNWDITYKDLMSIIVCDTSERQCMIHRCELHVPVFNGRYQSKSFIWIHSINL